MTSTITIDVPIIADNIENQEQLIALINGYSAAIDLEWTKFTGPYANDKTSIYAAAFTTGSGQSHVLHISDYPGEKELIEDILFYFYQFPLTFGWYSTGRIVEYKDKKNSNITKYKGKDSDFYILHKRCQYHGIESPFEINPTYVGIKWEYQQNNHIKHIDLCKVFDKNIVRANIFAKKYRGNTLNAVSKGLLGTGKYHGLDAGKSDISSLGLEEQINYSRRDAELTIGLAKYNNCLLLRIMSIIAEYCRMNFYLTCHTNLDKWFANLYNDMKRNEETNLLHVPVYIIKKVPVAGGHHSQPQKGFYVGVAIYELDVKGQYPNIIRIYNLSFDTIGCDCCEYIPEQQIDHEIIDVINEQLKANGINRHVGGYWVCRNKGAFPKIIEKLLTDRDKYQKLLKEEKSKPSPNKELAEEYNAYQITTKLLANAGAGLFAEEHFGFANYKVNELITGIGRWIHKKMEQIGTEQPYNFIVMFGFTDSTFFSNVASPDLINQFVQDFKDKIGVTIEIKDVYVNSIFYDEKNRSITWTGKENDNVIIKGLDGIDASECNWSRKWFRNIATLIVKTPDKIETTITSMLQEAYADLDNICKSERFEDLQFTQTVNKEVDEYEEGHQIRKLATEQNKKKGDIVFHYKTAPGKAKKTAGYSSYSKDISQYWNRRHLLHQLESTLEVIKFDFNSLMDAAIIGIPDKEVATVPKIRTPTRAAKEKEPKAAKIITL